MRILLFADIHVGSIKDTKYFYDVMTDIIDKEIMFQKTDLLVILGDYFDKLFKTNEDYVSLAIDIMSYIVRACRRCKTKIRIVYGTESHEMNQYGLFNYHKTSDSIDMKIFETVTEETIDGKKILYIPEEYIDDKHKHYQKYLYSGKHYDFIFGHGVIEDGMPAAVSYTAESKSNNKEKHVPHFKSGEFSEISNVCVFGHYHCFTNMGNSVYYLGSLFRDKFGEEYPKGYAVITEDGCLYPDSNNKDNNSKDSTVILCNTDSDNKYTYYFIENTQAYSYITFEFPAISEIYLSEENLINKIKSIKEENKEIFNGEKKGKIRLKFQTPDNLDTKFKETLRSILFDEKFMTSTVKETPTELISEIEEDIEDELDFVIDPSLPILDKIHRLMGIKRSEVMPISKLKKYLQKSLDEISARKAKEEMDDGL